MCFIADEETGKCVGNFRIAIRRRWNYENNVSAIVCYMSTGKFFLADCSSSKNVIFFSIIYIDI